MHPLYNEFLAILSKEDKKGAVQYILSKLDNTEISIVELYNELLTPSLNQMTCDEEEEEFCIWKEHIRSSIIRTIIENCYPYILKEMEAKSTPNLHKKIVVVCPSEEFHELGAKMVADFFTLVGFESTFVGANTPRSEIHDAVRYIKPDFIAISITNYYNLMEAKKVIDMLREESSFSGKIIVGGTAFEKDPDNYKKIGADTMLNNFEEIKKLAEENSK